MKTSGSGSFLTSAAIHGAPEAERCVRHDDDRVDVGVPLAAVYDTKAWNLWSTTLHT